MKHPRGWLRASRCVGAWLAMIGGVAACGGAPSPTAPSTLSPTVTAPATVTPTATATGTPTPCSCAPSDQCYQSGTCTGDGGCSYPTAPDGTPCANGGTICVAGHCTQPPLASLAVSPLTLSPGFSPSIHDYAVLCSTGMNALTLDMAATAGGTVSLSAPFTTSPAPAASVPVSLTENQAAVVLARYASGFAQQYWIRCLPHDFPLLVPSAHPEVGSPTPGWYFIGNLFVAAGSGPYAMIVDANGTPIWYHRLASGQANPTVVTPLPNSTVGITTSSNPSIGTLYFLETETTQAISTVGISLNNHELRSLPNGDFMLISYPTLTGVDLTGLGNYGPNSTILDCAVQEVDPRGNLVWDWRASAHTDPVRESVVPAGAGTDTSPADVYHCNSVDADADGNVLISFRHMNAVLFVSKATGKVVWKLGGTTYNKDGAQIITIQGDPEGAFYLQHDGRFQPDGDISVFDDHSAAAAMPGVARGVEYALDLGAGTAHVVWQYQAPANSAYLGSFRRYADGTNLIGWGAYTGSANLAFTEVDAAGHDLLDMSFVSHGNWSYRAEKVPVGSFDIDVLRRTAGLP
jgi:Arylsulfotransferase (ASST)